MEQVINKFADYIVGIYDSESSSESKIEFVNTKLLDILRSLGYSDSFAQKVVIKSQEPQHIIITYESWYKLYQSHYPIRRDLEQKIRDLLDNIILLQFSISNEPEKSIEDKIRRYFSNQKLDTSNIDRIIPLLSSANSFNEVKIINWIIFANRHKFGDLLRIKTAIDNLLRIMNWEEIEILNTDELQSIIREYLHAKELSDEEINYLGPIVDNELEQIWIIIKKEEDSIDSVIDNIIKTIENIILDYRIRKFLDSVEDILENITDQQKLFKNTYKISDSDFDILVGQIYYKKIRVYLKENKYFTQSSLEEFLDKNKGLSTNEFHELTWNIYIYPDPKINPETGESLDREGNVLPNCALCLNMLNINIPIQKEYSIKRLPCGGLFHLQCITDFQNEYGSICPTCG
jgi:hypothetical protein